MRESVVFVGARGSGKTSVGQAVAGILGIPFVDADEKFVKKHRMSILKYVDANGGMPNGWPPFRKEETTILEEICVEYNGIRIVLAAGGGAVAHNQGEIYRVKNVELVRGLGHVFYLSPSSNLEKSARILTDRLLADQASAEQRPPLTDEQDQFKDMLTTVTKRHPLYSDAAHTTVYTGEKTIEQVARDIAEFVK